MARPADAIRHAALEPGRGERPERAEIPDRARLGVVLQAAGLLSLCEAAGWRPVDGLARARVDAKGRLRGIAVEPGTCGEGCAPILLDLLLRLFRSERTVEGRGAARRAARQLVERWRGALHRPSADGAVAEILRVGPFLGGNGLLDLEEALEGVLVRGGQEIPWRAGRGARPDGAAGDPLELVRRGRWQAAARAFRVRPPRDRAERLAAARSFYGAGRAEAALVVLGEIEGVEAETLRATCRHALGELPGARESIRRLEAAGLKVAERLEASDVALRVLSLTGERDAAREWVARLVGGARGAVRLAAELVAATAAGDRGELDEMQRRLEAAAGAARRPELAERWHQVRTELAWERQQAEPMIEHGRQRLAIGRRRMGRYEAGRAWNSLGLGLTLAGRFGAAERAFAHAVRLLDGCDGPLGRTLGAANLADVRLRVGRPDGVETLLRAASACNRRSGNRTGLALDALLGVRLELVRGRLERALERAADLRERLAGSGVADVSEWLALLEARALGWLGRAGEARARLEAVPVWALRELEPEERPFLFALAGDTDRAVEAAGTSGLAGLLGPLVEGREPPPARWREVSKLEPYRRARLVLDAELASPGSVPGELREPAAELFRRLGAHLLAGPVERSRTVAWRSLGDFFERPSGDRAAIEELLAAVGHAEAELVLRTGRGERRLAGSGGRELTAERSAPLGDAELVLRAAEIDEPLRALFALFLRELPAPPAEAAARPGHRLIGESPDLLAAVERLRRFAPTRLPVLILGENGTGKELAAAAVHEWSGRGGRLVPLNCAGLPESLLLSELFGHARGAFTGADRERAGIFEAARGGTAFLDEIGDLPLAAQGSLLRVLQEREVRRVGESLARRVDVRFVAATNRELAEMVERESFRRDLFFRLKAATVVLPPLRERGGDVLLLADRFLAEQRRARPGLRLTSEARRLLLRHDWPGNVRELKNVLEAAAALTEDGRIAPEHLDLGSPPAAAEPARDGGYHAQVESLRRRLITGALESGDGTLADAARRLGVSRQYLSQYVQKHGLRLRSR